MKQDDLFLLFEKKKKKDVFVILRFFLKSSMDSFLEFILDSIYQRC